ncbi:MAG: signal recognition particle subunit SRP19/SEC65 family protein [Acidilobaceae archaeon]
MARMLVWPAYIDCNVGRRSGRRLSKDLCVKKPTIAEIVVAAEKLNLRPEVVKKSYPKQWWTYKEAVLVDKIGSKRATLKMLAQKIQDLRKHHVLT